MNEHKPMRVYPKEVRKQLKDLGISDDDINYSEKSLIKYAQNERAQRFLRLARGQSRNE